MNIFKEFEWRGLLHSYTEGASDHLAGGPQTFYIGFDPTAASLHVGSLLAILAMRRLQEQGHKPIAIVGGGTGLIGDPSGKSLERPLLTLAQLEANLIGIKNQLSRFLAFEGPSAARLINNADWLVELRMPDFLREVGKYFTVNYMLAKESVKRRLEQEDGLSFTEFSYMLLQAYDFQMLYERYGCTLQMGGSDQWGNIVAGVDLVKKVHGKAVHGLTFPLVTTSSGVKFGKTEAGAIWLDAALTTPFHFYQFWLNTTDQDVITYLKYFTMFNQSEIQELAQTLVTAPEKREVQRQLARAVTLLVHGESGLSQAERATAVLFGQAISNLGATALRDIFADVPSTSVNRAIFSGAGTPLVELLVACQIAPSKSHARRLVEGGGIYVNNHRIVDPKIQLNLETAIEGELIVLRKGTRDYHLLKLTA